LPDRKQREKGEKEGCHADLFKGKRVSAKGNKVAIIELCKQNNALHKIATETVKEGWMGKPKIALQTLWERGHVDPAKRTSLET
jgi:hypothetical protein